MTRRLQTSLVFFKSLPSYTTTDNTRRLQPTSVFFSSRHRKTNGDPYPKETLKEIVLAIQAHFHMNGRYVKLLDDPSFAKLKTTLESTMKGLSKEGYVRCKQQAEPISEEEEEKLWTERLLGDQSPKVLLSTIVYLFGVHFALGAVQEHKRLKVDQIQILYDQRLRLKYLKYTESLPEHTQGLKNPKVVTAYQNSSNPARCIVNLYQEYLNRRPYTDEKCSDELYLRPLANPKSHAWYSTQPLGINTLATIINRMCAIVGLPGKRSNHSLRATLASRLYSQGVDELRIAEITGHKSLALRNYRRATNPEQQLAISNLLYGNHDQTPSQPPPIPLKKIQRDQETIVIDDDDDDDDETSQSAPILIQVPGPVPGIGVQNAGPVPCTGSVHNPTDLPTPAMAHVAVPRTGSQEMPEQQIEPPVPGDGVQNTTTTSGLQTKPPVVHNIQPETNTTGAQSPPAPAGVLTNQPPHGAMVQGGQPLMTPLPEGVTDQDVQAANQPTPAVPTPNTQCPTVGPGQPSEPGVHPTMGLQTQIPSPTPNAQPTLGSSLQNQTPGLVSGMEGPVPPVRVSLDLQNNTPTPFVLSEAPGHNGLAQDNQPSLTPIPGPTGPTGPIVPGDMGLQTQTPTGTSFVQNNQSAFAANPGPIAPSGMGLQTQPPIPGPSGPSSLNQINQPPFATAAPGTMALQTQPGPSGPNASIQTNFTNVPLTVQPARVNIIPSEIVVRPTVHVKASDLVQVGDQLQLPRIVVNLDIHIDP